MMRGLSQRPVLAIWLTCLLMMPLGLLADEHEHEDEHEAAELIEQGRRIYQDAVLGSGAPLASIVEEAELHGDVRCERCHRRSGLGGGEGGQQVPPITGAFIFRDHVHTFLKPVVKRYKRPAYRQNSLNRVLARGIDVLGEPISGFMPRYHFGEDDLEALSAYLMQLSPSLSPGVEDERIHLATVVDSRLPASRQRALIDTAQHFVERENAALRAKQQRTRFRTRQQQWNVDSFRQWKLHVWRLKGEPKTWPEQLAMELSRQPVLLMIGGVVQGRWSPIHQFCEAESLPCLFPHTDQPQSGDDSHFTFYLSHGVAGEAELLASALSESGNKAGVLQVYRRGDRGERAAVTLRKALGDALPLRDRVLEPGESVKDALEGAGSDRVVLWLGRADLTLLAEVAEPEGDIYLSGTLSEDRLPPLPEAWLADGILIYPFSPPWQSRAGISRRFLRHERITMPGEGRLQAETFAAFSAVSQLLEKARHNLVREYLMERLEHMSEDLRSTGLYPHLSLAPGQRVASKGGYLLPLAAVAGDEKARKGLRWRVP